MGYYWSSSLTICFLLAVLCSFVQSQQDCGWPNSAASTNDRVFGGVETAPHEFPWAVYLEMELTNGVYLICSGTLISDQWIMTLTKCLPKNFYFGFAFLGVYNLSSTDKEPGQIVVNITDYRTNELMSLLQLQEPIVFNDYIRPICLPQVDDLNQHVDDVVLLTGWGAPDLESDSYEGPLRMVNSTVISDEECRNITDDASMSPNVICTSGGATSGSCVDNGGTMMFRKDQMTPWTQIGVIGSAHYSGCGSEYPIPHVRVQPFLEWIQSIINVTNMPQTQN